MCSCKFKLKTICNKDFFTRDQDAVITVFLAMVIVLLLSVLTVFIENARLSSASSIGKSIFHMAQKSILSEYYFPLYEKYHLLAVDSGFGENTIQKKYIEQKQIQYANKNLSNSAIQENKTEKMNFIMYNLILEEVKLLDYTTLLDQRGTYFKQQAVAYEKYSKAGDIAEWILSKANLLEQTSNSGEVLQIKAKTEEKFVDIDKKILQLIECIDGLCVDENGIVQSFTGNIKTKKIFVKKIQFGNITPETTGINNMKLFQALRNNYINPYTEIEQLINDGKNILSLIEQKNDLDMAIEKQNKKNSDIEDTKLIVPEDEINIKLLIELRDNLIIQISDKQKIFNTKRKILYQYQSDMSENLKKAQILICEINELRKEASGDISLFESILYEFKNKVTQDFFEEMQINIDSMKKYTDDDIKGIGMIRDRIQMEQDLKINYNIFQQLKNVFLPETVDNLTNYNLLCGQLSIMKQLYKGYCTEGLDIDYSGISLKSQKNGILSTAKTLLQSGLAGLVLEDEESLSKRVLQKGELPSELMGIEKEIGNQKLINRLKNLKKEDNEELVRDMLSQSETAKLSDGQSNGVEYIGNEALFLCYLEEHFTNFLTNPADETRKLSYELEYILCGSSLDSENVESIAVKLILLRSLTNILHVFSNREKTNQAQIFAASLVGFTGLPFLVSAVKYLTLLIWAVEEALVETAALFQGKRVSFYTNDKTFAVSFTELLSMNKSKIISKAKDWKDDKKGLTYTDYLKIMLFLQNAEKQNYRVLDIIQENIRFAYEDNFRLRNCLISLSSQMKFSMPQKFLLLPWFKRQNNINGKSFWFQFVDSAAY